MGTFGLFIFCISISRSWGSPVGWAKSGVKTERCQSTSVRREWNYPVPTYMYIDPCKLLYISFALTWLEVAINWLRLTIHFIMLVTHLPNSLQFHNQQYKFYYFFNWYMCKCGERIENVKHIYALRLLHWGTTIQTTKWLDQNCSSEKVESKVEKIQTLCNAVRS